VSASGFGTLLGEGMMPLSDQAKALLSSPVAAWCGAAAINDDSIQFDPVVNFAHIWK
jgi:hypothetical protein